MCTYLPSFEDRHFLEDRRHLFVSIIAYTRPARTCLPEKVSGSQLLWSSRSDPETIGNICLLVYLSSRQVKFGPILPPSTRSAENCPRRGPLHSSSEQPTTNNNKSVFLWDFFRDFSGISGDGAHLVRFCPGYLGMGPMLWGFVQDFLEWGASCEVFVQDFRGRGASCEVLSRISIVPHKFIRETTQFF